jgi:uncharacterized protein YegL
MVFVFDTSGSMSGDKIKQARDALKYCVGRLQESDKFNVIRFSTDVDAWRDAGMAATESNRTEAIKFIEGFEARGGTDINGALGKALAPAGEEGRMRVVVFLTDGKPTVGTTVAADVLEAVKKARKSDTRIFVFGVGHDVNTHLLDKIGVDHGGVSQYVEPKEDIEIKVSGFYDKISHPVLAKPAVKITGVTVRDVHPGELADLFAGGQITIFGRYKGNGKVTIKLTGDINGKPQEYKFEGVFEAKSVENAFIARLWATRRVGYLLDQIRLHGEEKELKDEVIQLSKEYAIMTPYTSYLVLETDADYKTHGIARGQVADGPVAGGKGLAFAPATAGAPAPAEGAWADKASMEKAWGERGREMNELRGFIAQRPAAKESEYARRKMDALSATTESAGGGISNRDGDGNRAFVPVFDSSEPAGKPGPVAHELKEESGVRAVTSSRAIDAYKSKDVTDTVIAPALKYVGKKVFYLIDGVWTDRDYKKGLKERKVSYGSEEYFKLLEEHHEWRQFFALGTKVIVCPDAENAVIVE